MSYRHGRAISHRDANEREIIAALESVGSNVSIIMSAKPSGFPDLVVGYHGKTTLLEVKMPLRDELTPTGKARTIGVRNKGRVLDPEQVRFFENWRGGALVMVRTIRQALWAIGACDEETERIG